MYIISFLDVHSTAPLRRNQNVTDVQTHFKDFHFLCFFFNWSFAARYIYPPLATIVSAWEYKKRYTVIQKCMWMALWEGWGGQRNSSKISSLNSQNYTCIYCSFVYRENFPSHFKFKEYCPLVFRQLRDRFGIDDSEYAVSADAACVTCMFIYHSATLRYVILLGTNKLKWLVSLA